MCILNKVTDTLPNTLAIDVQMCYLYIVTNFAACSFKARESTVLLCILVWVNIVKSPHSPASPSVMLVPQGLAGGGQGSHSNSQVLKGQGNGNVCWGLVLKRRRIGLTINLSGQFQALALL
jgi:hypothetical protein